jgi:hypothetical protein
MDRRTFLTRFGMGVGAVILAPGIINSLIVKKDDKILQLEKVDHNWRHNTLFIRIINNNPIPTEVMFFGIKHNLSDNFIPKGVKILIARYSILELNHIILANHIRILGLKMRVKKFDQFLNPFWIYKESPNGSLNSMLIQPFQYLKPDYQTTRIDMPSFELLLTASTYLVTKVNANEQVDYEFTINSAQHLLSGEIIQL